MVSLNMRERERERERERLTDLCKDCAVEFESCSGRRMLHQKALRDQICTSSIYHKKFPERGSQINLERENHEFSENSQKYGEKFKELQREKIMNSQKLRERERP